MEINADGVFYGSASLTDKEVYASLKLINEF